MSTIDPGSLEAQERHLDALTPRVLARYSATKPDSFPLLSEEVLRHVVQAVLEAAAEPPPKVWVRMPEDVVQAALLWGYVPPAHQYMELPDGRALLETDTTSWLVECLERYPALCKELPAKTPYGDFVQQCEDTLNSQVQSCDVRYVEVPLDFAQAVLDWYHIPQEASFTYGPSVEDVCENLATQAQAWSRVPLEDDPCDAFAAAEKAFANTGVAVPTKTVEHLAVED